MVDKILVPMDGSRKSLKALDYAIDTAKCFNSSILILRVVTLSMLEMAWNSPASGGPIIKQDFLKEADRRDKRTMTRVRKYLRDKLKTVSDNGVEGSFRVMVGDPADSIKQCCTEENIDLIVMNANNRGWLKRAIMGSVTDEILRTSSVPVLVLRPKKK
ncbi:MAG: universal stress protein [Dehalococcoidales bacterium]|nr:MAG: universal stress protein [Dehalococcoidales bacterium]